MEVGERFPVDICVLVCFGQRRAGGLVEVGVVVAGYYVFVLVREGRQEVNGGLQLGRSAMGGYIARMDEDIAIRDFAWIERVCV